MGSGKVAESRGRRLGAVWMLGQVMHESRNMRQE